MLSVGARQGGGSGHHGVTPEGHSLAYRVESFFDLLEGSPHQLHQLRPQGFHEPGAEGGGGGVDGSAGDIEEQPDVSGAGSGVEEEEEEAPGDDSRSSGEWGWNPKMSSFARRILSELR